MTAGTGQLGQNSRDRIVGTGKPEQGSWDMKAEIEQSEHDNTE
jgi:hypothetical protein